MPIAGLIGGLIVGFGTRLGSGCTSGHGVCGIFRLSPRSLAATAAFMLAGFATVAAMRATGNIVVTRWVIALVACTIFGAGPAISGMADPTRVRAFLDLSGGAWDPTLAFVMGGALIPITWRVTRFFDAQLPGVSVWHEQERLQIAEIGHLTGGPESSACVHGGTFAIPTLSQNWARPSLTENKSQ